MRITRPLAGRSSALVAVALLAGCSFFTAPAQVRGNKVEAMQLKELVPGTSTRADVTSLLGSPTAKASFDDNVWLYISEVTQPRIGRIQGVNSQQVVQLTFDGNGTLQTVKQLNQKDSKDVSVVARATPSPGSEASFMQQLLGNIGRYTPSAVGGSSPSGVSVGGQ